ncbi:MAG TPA: class I tRNA ligase family protein, partial [Candidatus Saccharimonadales bacterium]
IPFKDVYLHGLVRAEDGKKMSKSRPSSIIDPLDIIPKYGADSLRMALIMGVSPGNDQTWGWSKIEANRNFCNKLWNIARYIEDIVGNETGRQGAVPATAADHWILDKLRQFQEKTAADLDNYRFSEAYERLYHFIWDDLADWYIEASKAAPNKALLAYLLEAILTLAHPFAPFVTETVWQTLSWEADSILATRTLQAVPKSDKQQAADFAEIQAIVKETRLIINALKVSGVTLYYTDVPFLRDNAETIKRLSRLQAVTEVSDGTGLYLISTDRRCWLDIDKETARTYLEELEGKRAGQLADIKQLEDRLANKNYVKNAPRQVVEQTKRQLAETKAMLASIDEEQKRFGPS